MNEPRNVSVDSDWLQHVLKAKDESEQARADLLAQHAAEKYLILEDLRAILRALGLSDGARPIPAHDVVLREILPAIHALATTAAERLRSVHTNVEFALTMAGDPVSRREAVHGAIDSALATTAARASIEAPDPVKPCRKFAGNIVYRRRVLLRVETKFVRTFFCDDTEMVVIAEATIGGSHYWTLKCPECGKTVYYDTYSFEFNDTPDGIYAYMLPLTP